MPAPLKLNLVFALARLTDCTTRRCKCNEDGLICPDMYNCFHCKKNHDESNIAAPQKIELDYFEDFF